MLVTVLQSEWKGLLRTPARLIALFFYLACGFFALYAGQAYVEKWREAIRLVEVSEAEMQAEAVGFYDAGRKGPEDRPWVDMAAPLWAEWYTGTYLGKAPAPLSALSLGLADSRPNYTRVSRFTSPFDKNNKQELANPEKLLAGNFDLAFVIAFLAPLLLIVLSFDVMGYERDRGILRLVVLQAGSLPAWLFARMAFHWLTVAIPTALLWLTGGWLTGALPHAYGQWLGGLALSLLYLFFWTALFTLIVARGKSVTANALAMAVSWVVLCLVVPALVNQLIQSGHPPGYETELTDAQRADVYELYQTDIKDLLPAFFERNPQLREAPFAAAAADSALISRHVYDEVAFHLRSEVEAEVTRLEQERERRALASAWYNPVYAFQHGLNRLAGNEAGNYRGFRADIDAAVRDKLAFILEYAFSLRECGKEDFLRLSALAGPNRDYAAFPAPVSWLALGAGGLLALLLSLPALGRGAD